MECSIRCWIVLLCMIVGSHCLSIPYKPQYGATPEPPNTEPAEPTEPVANENPDGAGEPPAQGSNSDDDAEEGTDKEQDDLNLFFITKKSLERAKMGYCTTNQFMPDPRSPRRFLWCVHGVYTIMECPYGTIYCHYQQTCCGPQSATPEGYKHLLRTAKLVYGLGKDAGMVDMEAGNDNEEGEGDGEEGTPDEDMEGISYYPPTEVVEDPPPAAGESDDGAAGEGEGEGQGDDEDQQEPAPMMGIVQASDMTDMQSESDQSMPMTGGDSPMQMMPKNEDPQPMQRSIMDMQDAIPATMPDAMPMQMPMSGDMQMMMPKPSEMMMPMPSETMMPMPSEMMPMMNKMPMERSGAMQQKAMEGMGMQMMNKMPENRMQMMNKMQMQVNQMQMMNKMQMPEGPMQKPMMSETNQMEKSNTDSSSMQGNSNNKDHMGMASKGDAMKDTMMSMQTQTMNTMPNDGMMRSMGQMRADMNAGQMSMDMPGQMGNGNSETPSAMADGNNVEQNNMQNSMQNTMSNSMMVPMSGNMPTNVATLTRNAILMNQRQMMQRNENPNTMHMSDANGQVKPMQMMLTKNVIDKAIEMMKSRTLNAENAMSQGQPSSSVNDNENNGMQTSMEPPTGDGNTMEQMMNGMTQMQGDQNDNQMMQMMPESNDNAMNNQNGDQMIGSPMSSMSSMQQMMAGDGGMMPMMMIPHEEAMAMMMEGQVPPPMTMMSGAPVEVPMMMVSEDGETTLMFGMADGSMIESPAVSDMMAGQSPQKVQEAAPNEDAATNNQSPPEEQGMGNTMQDEPDNSNNVANMGDPNPAEPLEGIGQVPTEEDSVPVELTDLSGFIKDRETEEMVLQGVMGADQQQSQTANADEGGSEEENEIIIERVGRSRGRITGISERITNTDDGPINGPPFGRTVSINIILEGKK